MTLKWHLASNQSYNSCKWVNLKAIKRLVEADALKMEIIPNPKYLSTAIWTRFVAGLNAHLRTVRQGNIRSALVPVISWISSHGNPQLEPHGVRIGIGWFQATASVYYQLRIVATVNEHFFKNVHNADIMDTRKMSQFHARALNKFSRPNLQLRALFV